MTKVNVSKFLVILLGLSLIGYSATRSVDFLTLTLPPSQRGAAFFGLAGLDLGVVIWLAYLLRGARGAYQRAVAGAMIAVDLAGVIALLLADTLLRAGQAGVIGGLSQDVTLAVIIGFSVVLACNIVASAVCHLYDPDELKRRAQAEAQDDIELVALQAIHAETPKLAAEVAPAIVADFLEATRAKYLTSIIARQKAAKSGALKQARELLAQLDDMGNASHSSKDALAASANNEPGQPAIGTGEAGSAPLFVNNGRHSRQR